MAFFNATRSLAFHVSKAIPESASDSDQILPNLTSESISKAESHPPSPTGKSAKVELSSTLKRLGELEEKVDMLLSKPNVMPYEKEELLNAAVYRVDALEAELIATKKVTICHFQTIASD